MGFLHGLPQMLFWSPDWDSYYMFTYNYYVLSSLASTLPQFKREYTCLWLDTHLVKSVWFQNLLDFLVCCPPGPSLWEHVKFRSPMSPVPPSMSTHGIPPAPSSNLTYVLHQESKPMSPCSLLHLSVQMFSLAALWELFLFKHKIMKLTPSKWRQIKYFLILSRKNVPVL